MRIGVVLPTYKDTTGKWFNMINRFLDSLQFISEVDGLVFLVNYQNVDPTYSDSTYILTKFEDVVYRTNPTWELNYVLSDPYPNPISMVRIRNDCMLLDPNCDLYLFIDDDMKFNKGAGARYNQIIQFFNDDPDLGLVMSAGFLGGYNYIDNLKYAVKKHWTVCRGLFIRNIHTCNKSPIYPEAALQMHEGGYEEMLVAWEMVRRGFLMATHFNNPTTHKVMFMDKDVSSDKDARYENDQIHNIDISFASASRYLKHEYGINLSIESARDYQRALGFINKMRN